MKKASNKSKSVDIAGEILKVQQQLTFLDKKVDALVNQLSKPAVRFDQPRYQGQAGVAQNNNYRERVLHKAICADCKKECEVPFRPTGDRPVYCKDCFSKRKAHGGPFLKERPENPAPVEKKRHSAVRRKPSRKNK